MQCVANLAGLGEAQGRTLQTEGTREMPGKQDPIHPKPAKTSVPSGPTANWSPTRRPPGPVRVLAKLFVAHAHLSSYQINLCCHMQPAF